NRIHRHVPLIEDIIEHTLLSVDPSAETGWSADLAERFQALLEVMGSRDDRRLNISRKILFLSAFASHATLVLPDEIENDTISKTGNRGRRIPFVQSHRYVSLSNLRRCPPTTSGLFDAAPI
ncbi:MAG: hypothetical protein IID07_16450, partial [Gemmatimonadetes bacterium]|nr:hypothetical protein [Gemmatimonadota bacterium]